MALDNQRQRAVEAVFDKTVRPALFGDRTGDDAPVAVLWVHPPWHAHGPGLDRLNDRYGGHLVVIDGQRLRGALPEYDEAMRHPLTAQAATREDVGYLVELGIDYASRNGISVLVPGTGTRPTTPMGTAATFADRGFGVDLVAVAEPMEDTRLNAVHGYFDPDDPAKVWPRPSNRAANWQGLADTVRQAAQSPDIHRVVVETRAGELLGDTSSASAVDAETALADGRQLNLTRADAEDRIGRWQQALEWAHESGQVNDDTLPVLEELTTDAVTATRFLAAADPAVRGTAIARVEGAVDAIPAPVLRRPLLAYSIQQVTRARDTARKAVHDGATAQLISVRQATAALRSALPGQVSDDVERSLTAIAEEVNGIASELSAVLDNEIARLGRLQAELP